MAPRKHTPKPDSAADDGQEIPLLFIRTCRNVPSRRRAGFRFGREGIGIALDALSEAQVRLLRSDPLLIVEEGAFPADDGSNAP